MSVSPSMNTILGRDSTLQCTTEEGVASYHPPSRHGEIEPPHPESFLEAGWGKPRISPGYRRTQVSALATRGESISSDTPRSRRSSAHKHRLSERRTSRCRRPATAFRENREARRKRSAFAVTNPALLAGVVRSRNPTLHSISAGRVVGLHRYYGGDQGANSRANPVFSTDVGNRSSARA